MSESYSEEAVSTTAEEVSQSNNASASKDVTPPSVVQPHATRAETRHWWIKLFLQPTLFLGCGAILLIGLGVAQRSGLISSGGSGHSQTSSANSGTRYICPMMCTPPRAEPAPTVH